MMKIALSILLLFIAFFVQAQPPTPPKGKVWILNKEMSDEFGPEGPNLDVWNIYSRDRSWDRTAAFDPKVVEAEKAPDADNYYLTMNPIWYYDDEVFTNQGSGRTYYFAGGALDTKKLQTYGYFEVRLRPSDFPFGSGVFMNSRGNPATICEEKYATELDIIENISYTGPGSAQRNFNYIQHVNSHTKNYHYIDGSGNCVNGGNITRGADSYPLEDPQGWVTVGMWWEDANNAHFYNDNRYFSSLVPGRDFKIPMALILSMETYTWGEEEDNAGNPTPEQWMWEEDFRTKDQRAVKYDWVRTWKLIDIDATTLNDGTDNVSAYEDIIESHPGQVIQPTLIYSAKDLRTVSATLLSPDNVELSKMEVEVSKGVRSKIFDFVIEEEAEIGENYLIKFDILEGETIISSDTTILKIQKKSLEKKLWGDLIPTNLEPGKTEYTIEVRYETDTASTINVEFKNPDGSNASTLVKTNVEAGKGVIPVTLSPTTPLAKAKNYFFKVYMFRRGMNWRDPLSVDISPVFVNIEESIPPSIQINRITPAIYTTDTLIDVNFTYSSGSDGALQIELIDSQDKVVAKEQRSERSGSRSLTRSVNIDSTLSPGDDYKVAISFRPENESLPSLLDTLYNVSILGVVSTNTKVKHLDNLSLYPNPTSGELTLILPSNNLQIKRVSLSEINGKVHNLPFLINGDGINLNLSKFSPGVYFLLLTTKSEIFSAKIIKTN